MANFVSSKKFLWIFAIIGGIAVLVMVVAAVVSKRSGSATLKPAQLKVDKKNIDSSQLPDKFPADMPMEKGAKITQNYTATTNDGRFQATRVFETTKALDDNYKLYNKYFQQNGWQLDTGKDLKDLKVITAHKGKVGAQVTIDYGSTKSHTVDITITQNSQ